MQKTEIDRITSLKLAAIVSLTISVIFALAYLRLKSDYALPFNHFPGDELPDWWFHHRNKALFIYSPLMSLFSGLSMYLAIKNKETIKSWILSIPIGISLIMIADIWIGSLALLSGSILILLSLAYFAFKKRIKEAMVTLAATSPLVFFTLAFGAEIMSMTSD